LKKEEKKVQAEEVERTEQKNRNRLHEQLAEQAEFEAVQLTTQETARVNLRSFQKLTEAAQGSGEICKRQRLHRLALAGNTS